jgi:hypothetical protein
MTTQMEASLPDSSFKRALNTIDAEYPIDGLTITQGPLAVFAFVATRTFATTTQTGCDPSSNPVDCYGAGFDDLASIDGMLPSPELTSDYRNQLSLPQLTDAVIPSDMVAVRQSCTAAAPAVGSFQRRIMLLDGFQSPLPQPLPPPDDFLLSIPANVQFLLDHFSNDFTTVLPFTPWKTLHLPIIMMTLGELVVWKRANHFRVALFYAVLALSSYHVDRSSANGEHAGHWWHVGTSHYHCAASELHKGLERDQTQVHPAKYSDTLITLLTMVTVCVGLSCAPSISVAMDNEQFG